MTTKIGSGATPRGGNASYKNDGIALIRSLNIHDLEFRYESLARIDEHQASALANVEVAPGDVLLNITGASIARCAQVPKEVLPARVNQHVSILRPKPDVLDGRFLTYLLVSKETKDQLLGIGDKAGATRQALTKGQLQSFQIPLPPLEEQKRIVAVLDQAFAALDRARANAEANLADAKELVTRAVEHELDSEELGQLEPLGGHIDLLTGFAFKSRGYTDKPSDIRLMRGDNIVQGGFRWEGVKRWPIGDRSTYSKYELSRDDVLIAMDRTWVSAGIKFAIVDDDALPSLLVQRVARLRSRSSILPKYIGYWIGSRLFESYVLAIQTGLGVPHVSGRQISDFPVRVPSLPGQKSIIERLDNISEGAEALVDEYVRKLTDIADLRQSLLQKAFSGQLTA